MKLVVLTPHFAPDVAPTGAVIDRIAAELVELGHEIQVITSLPWYREHRIEPGYEGKLVRREKTLWGEIVRVHPFPTDDKNNIMRRAASFTGFSAVVGAVGARGGPVDGVLAVSPPLTLGLDGWLISSARRASFVFNIQDVYPDIAVELGLLTNRAVIKASRRLERFCYRRADAITVLSDDLRANLSAKTPNPGKIHVIPNFVDTERIKPLDRENGYRREFGLIGRTVVMYAGNVGFSQSLELMLDAAAALVEEDVVFVINGQGARRDDLQKKARGLGNVRFIDMQPPERLPEVLAAADIHVVPLKKGLAASSVPSKTYSILAAGRPWIASVDPGSEVARLAERSGAGVAIPPDDPEAFTKALTRLLEHPKEGRAMGARGRSFVEGWASPGAVARAYEELFLSLRR